MKGQIYQNSIHFVRWTSSLHVEPNHIDSHNQKKANPKMWILIDSVASPEAIPDEVMPLEGPSPMVVYSSSPRHSRWKLVRQSNISLAIVIMNPWSKWEAELL